MARRSKKEMEALKSGYLICLEVIDVIGDIIVGCEEHEFSQEDIDRVEKANVFKNWFENKFLNKNL